MKVLTNGPQDIVSAFAAEELKSYLERMLPQEGQIYIALEAGDSSGPGAVESFRVSLTPTGGSISASVPRALLTGVYDALRRLGCRFLAPGRENELVPEIEPGDLQLHYEHTASFAQRGVCIEGADSRENILNFIDWLPKAGFNSFFLQFKSPYIFLARWYEHRGNPTLPPEPYTKGDAVEDMLAAQRELRRRGILLHKAGHGWTGEVLGFDALTWDKSAPLAEDHRALAAMVGGERGLFMGIPADTNLCLSNPEAVDKFANLVLEYARENSDMDYLHIWLADEYNNVCECPECRKSTPSDQYVALLNEIDRRLTAEGLRTRIAFLLYQELLWPPVRERLINPDRFVLMFAPISRSFAGSYGEPGGRPLPEYRRNKIRLPVDLGENLDFLRGWQRVFEGASFVYDYPLGRAHYGDVSYVHMARVIGGDILRLRDLGLGGYMSCQELRAGLPNFLPNYVMGRTLLDESADTEAVIEEYIRAAYGEGWETARDYLFGLSDLEAADYINGNGPRVDPAMAARFEAMLDLTRRYEGRIRELFAGSRGVSRGYWERLQYLTEYVKLFAGALLALASGDAPESRRLYGEFAKFIRENELNFQPWLDVYRVLEVTGKYTGLEFPEE